MTFPNMPQWIDMGPGEDFGAPLGSLATKLKERLKKKRMEDGLTEAGKADVVPMGDVGAGKEIKSL